MMVRCVLVRSPLVLPSLSVSVPSVVRPLGHSSSSSFFSRAFTSTSQRSTTTTKSTTKTPTKSLFPSPLITPSWLNSHLQQVKVIDGSWHMPTEQQNNKHAQLFDLDACSDHSIPLPHMLPTESQLALYMGALGIKETDPIVIYDTKGIFSAPRVWYTLRVFGGVDVAVLDGGLPLWQQLGFPIQTGPASQVHTVQWNGKANISGHVVTMADIHRNLQHHTFPVCDARSSGRFTGTDPEPRPGMSSGHIPGSVSIPFMELLKQHPTLKATIFHDRSSLAGYLSSRVDLSDPNAPIVTSCGTGVTACVVALALELLGHRNVKVYDGSWTEWASQPNPPIQKGI